MQDPAAVAAAAAAAASQMVLCSLRDGRSLRDRRRCPGAQAAWWREQRWWAAGELGALTLFFRALVSQVRSQALGDACAGRRVVRERTYISPKGERFAQQVQQTRASLKGRG